MEAGAQHVIDILTEKPRMSMGLCGAATLSDLDRTCSQSPAHQARVAVGGLAGADA